jgi:hypothetical protein
LLGDILSHPDLPSGLVERCLDVLKAILPDERELIRVTVEVIVELRENALHVDDENAAVSIFFLSDDVCLQFYRMMIVSRMPVVQPSH